MGLRSGGGSLIGCFVGKVAGAHVYVSIDTHFVAYCSDSFRTRSKSCRKGIFSSACRAVCSGNSYLPEHGSTNRQSTNPGSMNDDLRFGPK